MDRPATPPSTLQRARQIAREHGVWYAYSGNVHDPDGDSSWCHHCGKRVIGRDWYQLTAWQLTADGRCAHCGTRIPGVFDGPPGDWGRRRRAVRGR
jgi:pyruvate formate lyase activating enzyme